MFSTTYIINFCMVFVLIPGIGIGLLMEHARRWLRKSQKRNPHEKRSQKPAPSFAHAVGAPSPNALLVTTSRERPLPTVQQ